MFTLHNISNGDYVGVLQLFQNVILSLYLRCLNWQKYLDHHFLLGLSAASLENMRVSASADFV